MFYALDTFADPPQVVAQGTSIHLLKKALDEIAVPGTRYTIVTTNGMSIHVADERNIYVNNTINRMPS